VSRTRRRTEMEIQALLMHQVVDSCESSPTHTICISPKRQIHPDRTRDVELSLSKTQSTASNDHHIRPVETSQHILSSPYKDPAFLDALEERFHQLQKRCSLFQEHMDHLLPLS
jgi:hypothetical protein